MRSIPSELTRKLVKAYWRRVEHKRGPIMEKNMTPGEPLIHQDDLPENVYIILNGSLKIHHNTPKGTEYLVAIGGPGEIIGEIEALTGEAYACAATAIRESTVGVIPKGAYAQWLDEEHDFALLINHAMSYRLQKVVKRSATNLSYPLEYSVLKLFEMLAEDEGSLRLAVTKEDLANYLGTNTRSINRILRDLQEKNVLLPSRHIEVVSMEQLERAMRAYDD